MKEGVGEPRHARCRELLVQIARSVEGDLPPARRRALARHLKECHRCGAFSASLRQTVELCQGLGQPLSGRALARARANVARLVGPQKPQRQLGPQSSQKKSRAQRRAQRKG
jgi:anti-sigma factor RsiW